MGNHDAVSIALLDPRRFNEAARLSAEWTRSTLTANSQAYLAALPLLRHLEGLELSITLVHGSPYEPEDFHYIFDCEDARSAFAVLDDDLAFVGHSHFPQSFAFKHHRAGIEMHERGRRGTGDDLDLAPGTKYIINVGSVGQPRDGDPFASYALLDTMSRRIRWRRVAYDVASVQAKIRAVGLPERNASRLSRGN